MKDVKNYEALERTARLMGAYQKRLNQGKQVMLIRPDEKEQRVKYGDCESMIDRMEDHLVELELSEVENCRMILDERTILKVGEGEFLLGPVLIKKEPQPDFLAEVDDETAEEIMEAIYDRICTLCEGDREFKVIEL